MVTIAGQGTSPDVWSRWPRRFSPLELAGCRRLVVVAPHPDDEVLGAGGLMCAAAAVGIDVQVLAVTDGDASHPGSPTLTAGDLTRLRPRESADALATLELTVTPVRLRIPDGAVDAHEALVAEALMPLLAEEPAHTWCLATWRGDGHPDHEATGRAAAAASGATGARLLEYPVWMWHWAVPDDARVPWVRARSVSLVPTALRLKTAAVRCFRTQVVALSDDPRDAPILPGYALERLLRPCELVFA